MRERKLFLLKLVKMSSSKSFVGNHSTKKPVCHFGKQCTHFPHCSYRHSPENTPDCPYVNTPTGCTKSDCPYAHPKGYVRMCPYMNTPAGCTNLHCHFRHPKGFVHACIFGEKCEKRATGECQFLHPDERGFTGKTSNSSTKPPAQKRRNQRDVVPHREAPPPPLPPRDVHPIATQQQSSEIVWNCSKPFELSITATPTIAETSEDEYYDIIEPNGTKYRIDSTGNKIGAYNSDGEFTCFCSIYVDIPDPNTSEPDYTKITEFTDQVNNHDVEQLEWNRMTEEYDPYSDDDKTDDATNTDDEWETDPDAYN